MMRYLDPEEARAIIDPALKVMIDAVHHYGGYVVQSTGDGIFALFGAPTAHEDHPQRALHAAIAMREDLHSHGEIRQIQGRPEVEARIGINTGEVVMRTVLTGGHTEYTPVGHAVNLAARMQTIAPPGGIVVSEDTGRLVEGYFELGTAEPVVVKGISESINVYAVRGLGPLRTHFELAAQRGLTPFVGREYELLQMKRVLELVGESHGQLIALVADAGTGKSRLFHEFKAALPFEYKLFEAHAVSHGKASAWMPVLELLHRYFDLQASDNPAERRGKVRIKLTELDPALNDALPYLFGLLGISESPDPIIQLDSQIKRRRMLEAIKRILIRESLNQPLLVVFEDLHWVDAESQALLNLLADSIANSRVLLLFNFRPEYRHEWGNKSIYSQLHLEPLDQSNADAMLSALLGEGSNLAPLKRLVIQRTGGNPFFIEEMVQALFDDGTLSRNGAVKVERPLAQLRLPPTVQGVLGERIDRLPTDEKDLLQTLAVLGRESVLSLIRQIVPAAEHLLEQRLAALQAADFIYERATPADAEYVFKHALTQQAAYELLLIERRKRLHVRAGAAMELLYSGHLEDHFGQLAYHFSRTENSVKALEYQSKAGDQAQKRYAYATAVVHFSDALELIGQIPWTNSRDKQELTLRLSLGMNLIAITSIGSPVAHENFARARELCRNQNESMEILPALWGLCWFYIGRGELDTARELGKEMLELVANSIERLPWLLANTAMGPALVWSGEFTSARIRLEHGYFLYEQHTPPAQAITDFGVVCLSYLAFTLWSLGFPDQALSRVRESLTLARRLGHVHSIGHALTSVALLHWFRRDTPELMEYAETAIAFATEHELAFWAPMAGILRGCALSEQGGREQAVLEIERELAAYQATGSELSLPMFLGGLVQSYKTAGRIDKALRVLRTAFTVIDKGRLYEAELFRHRAELLLMQTPSGIEEASLSFHAAIEIARHQNAKSWELRATMSLARLLDKQGRRAEAHAMLAAIYNWFTEGFGTADLKDAKSLLDALGL